MTRKLSFWTRVAHIVAGGTCLVIAGISLSGTYGLIGHDMAEDSAKMLLSGILGRD